MARTLLARYYKEGSEILIDRGIPNNPRSLTPRERYRLMGFPIPVSDTWGYQGFRQSSIVPIITEVSKIMRTLLILSALKKALHVN